MKSFGSGISISRVLGTVALVFGALMAWDGQARSDCSPHAASPHVLAMSGEHLSDYGTAAWSTRSDHNCNHCPPAECSGAAPCATSVSAALSATVLPIVGFRALEVGPRGRFESHAFSPLEPPTPPPQMVS